MKTSKLRKFFALCTLILTLFEKSASLPFGRRNPKNSDSTLEEPRARLEDNCYCWPVQDTKAIVLYPRCRGILLSWEHTDVAGSFTGFPRVTLGRPFNFTFRLHIEESTFYPWLLAIGALENANSGNGFQLVDSARMWCLEATCAPDTPLTMVTEHNCCLHGVTVFLHRSDAYLTNLYRSSGSIFDVGFQSSSPLIPFSWGSVQKALWTVSVPNVVEEGGHAKLTVVLSIMGLNVAIQREILVHYPRCSDHCPPSEEGCIPCPMDDNIFVIVIVSTTLGVVILLNTALYIYLRRRLRFSKRGWLIDYAEIKPEIDPVGSLWRCTTLKRNWERRISTESNLVNNQLISHTAIYRGSIVAVKAMKATFPGLSVPHQIKKEIRLLRTLNQPNLCRLLGVTFHNHENLSVVWEFCSRGSLHDFLVRKDVPLDWLLRFSFVTDVSRGMCYLHAQAIAHGRLKSRNCLIAEQWTVKVADFGLDSLRVCDSHGANAPEELPPTKMNDLSRDTSTDLVTALDDVSPQGMNGSVRSQDREKLQPLETNSTASQESPSPSESEQESNYDKDVSDFGAILIETAVRSENDCNEESLLVQMTAGMNRSDSVYTASPKSIKTAWNLPLTKPDDREGACPSPLAYYQLVRACRLALPSQRPSFVTIKKQLDNMNPTKESPSDLIMAIIERYNDQLEKEVRDRTEQLRHEQEKTKQLLYAMLPKSVADNLQRDGHHPAQHYESATIYFSDIVEFTSYCASVKPMDVVKLLNDFYTVCDEICGQFDVYKVETIGDSYMVTSGVPEPNGSKHVVEICKLAMEMLDAARLFVIPNMPGEPLQIRIGIHTGPVCAGVVGTRMPRYCLFGDTVNTAARMESNGKAYRIHASHPTYQLCRQVNNTFKFKYRGTIPVKGKGEMTTWWLTGRQNLGSQEGTIGSSEGTQVAKAASAPSQPGEITAQIGDVHEMMLAKRASMAVGKE